jgi:hypothetical protein
MTLPSFQIALLYFFAIFAALLCVLCGQKLLTAKSAKDAKKPKLHHYRVLKNLGRRPHL